MGGLIHISRSGEYLQDSVQYVGSMHIILQCDSVTHLCVFNSFWTTMGVYTTEGFVHNKPNIDQTYPLRLWFTSNRLDDQISDNKSHNNVWSRRITKVVKGLREFDLAIH